MTVVPKLFGPRAFLDVHKLSGAYRQAMQLQCSNFGTKRAVVLLEFWKDIGGHFMLGLGLGWAYFDPPSTFP